MLTMHCQDREQNRTIQIDIREDEIPDTCPLCHQGIDPVPEWAGKRNTTHQIVFRCPKKKCGSLFIAYYNFRSPNYPFALSGVAPRLPVRVTFPKEVTDLSGQFATIYNQALEAEASGLDQICGVGFRKALEFLIKDYVIYLQPKEKESILKASLSQCINNHVADANLKTCATRAAWLGNDEAHYLRSWTDKDIGDLKTLIRLSVNCVHNDVLTKSYEQAMPQQ